MMTELDLIRTTLKIRYGIIEAIGAKGGGHIGGSLDLAELFAVLYTSFMRVRPQEPNWDGRDRLVCSKGHAGPVCYSTLALKGFFPAERLLTLNQDGSMLPGHCDRCKVPGIDATTGSLGQGLSLACGLALGLKLSGGDQRVYCILGDGESAEGQIWESAQFASHFKLDNLIAFLDWNKKQIDGYVEEVMSLGDPVKKFEAFGWNTLLVDGSNVMAIQEAIQSAINNRNSKPKMIILNTIKGAGIPCIERLDNNHCIGFPQPLYEQSIAYLKEQAVELGVDLNWIFAK